MEEDNTAKKDDTTKSKDYDDIDNPQSASASNDSQTIQGNLQGNKSKSWKEYLKPNISLIPCKSFYLCFYGSIGSLMPYLSIYFKQLGLGPEQIGLIAGIRPLMGFISGPFWGALADRFHIRRWLLLLSLIAWIGFYLGLGFVPPAGRSSTCPKDLPIHLNNSHLTHTPKLAAHHQHPSIYVHSNNTKPGLREIYKEDIGWMYNSKGLDRVFLSLLFLIMFGEIFQSPSGALADVGTLEQLGEGDMVSYGHQRAWGAIGFGTSAFVVGVLISQSRHKVLVCGIQLVFSNYMLPFYVFAGLMAVAFLSASQFRFLEEKEVKTSAGSGKKVSTETHVTKDVFKVFLSLHHGSWLTASYFIGVCNGIIWGFLYWHLENLGASQTLMGVASACSCASEFIMFFLVNRLIDLMGYMGVLYFGLFCYSVRFAVYALIVNPWMVLPAEILQGITFASVWVSLTAYSTMTVPRASLGTIQGVMHGVYWGLGSGSGHMIGGLLISMYGASVTFLSMAISSIVVMALFFGAQMVGRKPASEETIELLANEVKEPSKAEN